MTTASGTPVVGATVNWSVAGGASVSPTATRTDARGYTETTLTLGAQQGSYMARAGGSGIGSVSFIATATPTKETALPGSVTDLKVTAASATSVTLRWTPVEDGTGHQANYALRYGTPAISWDADAATEVSLAGVTASGPRRYTFEGLDPGTTYEFRLVSYRGELGKDAVFGNRSNKVSARTASTQKRAKGGEVGLTPARVTLEAINASHTLTAAATDGSGARVKSPGFTWKSLNTAVATVTASGVVTARARGNAKIVVSAACCGADTSVVTVDQVANKVALSPAAPGKMDPGATKQFTATVKDANGFTISGASVKWSSADPSVATVDDSGLVTAVASGDTKIKATSGGVTGSAPLSVSDGGGSGGGSGGVGASGEAVFFDDFSSGAKGPGQDAGTRGDSGAATKVSRERAYSGQLQPQVHVRTGHTRQDVVVGAAIRFR